MSFLGFGKKKPGAREGSVPTATPPSAIREKDNLKVAATGPQANTPNSSVNNSLNSLRGASPEQPRPKPEPESQIQQYGVRPGTSSGAPPATPATNLYPWSQRQLSFTSNQPNPFPRYGAAVNVMASKEGDIYVMGGLVNGSTVKGDLWMVEAGGGSLACFPVRTEAEGPGPRVGHASLLVGNAFIVFGGDTKQDESDPLDDTLYLLNTSTKQWSRALPPGLRPAGRYGHTLNILGSKLYVFGGQVDGRFFNDLIAFNLNQLSSPANHWEVLVPDSADDKVLGRPAPLGRTNHTVVTYADKLYLFGGTDGMQWFNDVWTFDPSAIVWSQLDCIGYIPQPREGHSAALVNDVMYIFGGRTQEGDDLGDLAAFRITSRRWYTFQNMGPSPSPRSGHSMTAFDKQIIVLAGEPSSPQRDPQELSLAYVLDTAKIRYPNDQQIQQTPTGERVGGNRRPSADRNGNRGMPPRDGGSISNIPQPGGPGSRLPRAAGGPQSGPGPPPLQQAPPPQSHHPPPQQLQQIPPIQQGQAPRVNGSGIPTPTGPRSRTPTKDTRGHGATPDASRGPSFERNDHRPDMSSNSVDLPRSQPSRSLSPVTMAKPLQPQQTSRFPTTHSDEQAPASTSSALRSQPLSRQARQQASIDGFDSSPQQDIQQAPSTSSLSLPREPVAPQNNDAALNKHIEGLTKELDQAKKSNAWYTSELALARKAGYNSNNQRASLDGTAKSLGEDDKPLIEALIGMKAELAEVQSSFAVRVDEAAQKVAGAEQQRDAAVREAVYAKAKLAAHGGTPSASPQLDDSTRDLDGSDRSDGLRKLGLALALQRELQSKLENVTTMQASEKRAREVAEENAEAAQKRVQELDQSRNPGEVESLRAELHDAQKQLRDESTRRNEAQSQVEILEVDKEDLQRQLEEARAQSADHGTMLVSLREAVTSSRDKYDSLERKLQQERETRENIQHKLVQLRTEHEERTAELESTTKKLRDSEELADKHALEAEAHRNLVISGLDKLNVKKGDDNLNTMAEKRVAILQQQVKEANVLVTKCQGEADMASEKLRRAEERIAGLEAYQQQASRESLGVRKQLQEAVRNAQTFQSQHADLKQQLESHQREATALAIQHGALKDLLDERSTSAGRNLDSPSGRRGSPDVNRIRELEQLLEESHSAHSETKSSFEVREQESEKAFREKLEQLEQDYQSAVSYVKGTEKMLKHMKDQLARSKAHNNRLQLDLEKSQSKGGQEDVPADWEAEREALHQEIAEMQESVKGSVFQLERQMKDVQAELRNVQNERDHIHGRYEHLAEMSHQSQHDIEKLRSENAALESRAMDAESKVSLLLDQVETSVDNYRRQSQNMMNPNGTSHTRDASTASTFTGAAPRGGHHSQNNSIGEESSLESTGLAERSSMALDNLASELETLRTQWEGTHRTYRLSNNFDFERSPSNGGGRELSNSLASWRKRLDAEERDKEMAVGATPNSGPESAPEALRTGQQRHVDA